MKIVFNNFDRSPYTFLLRHSLDSHCFPSHDRDKRLQSDYLLSVLFFLRYFPLEIYCFIAFIRNEMLHRLRRNREMECDASCVKSMCVILKYIQQEWNRSEQKTTHDEEHPEERRMTEQHINFHLNLIRIYSIAQHGNRNHL